MTLVDSCVLLDLMTDDPTWADWSEAELAKAQDVGQVVINPIVYAEVSVAYAAIEDLDAVLPAEEFVREPLPYEAGFLAGKAFLRYRKQGGTKAAPLPDFYIGAHAAVRGHRLLTRDATRYRTYFPTIELICP
ncbi:type II toxin-antitoxin system VapC family toxin [Kitasatospora sp. NPDC088134]|uniref:type II toxin-antitoxin system VapC family toxin n=1 Tax=Kitasatospora sp. NPDC088134 TaxID=3364071 RepID=UPI00381B7D24